MREGFDFLGFRIQWKRKREHGSGSSTRSSPIGRSGRSRRRSVPDTSCQQIMGASLPLRGDGKLGADLTEARGLTLTLA